jgi:hypothetical protein
VVTDEEENEMAEMIVGDDSADHLEGSQGVDLGLMITGIGERSCTCSVRIIALDLSGDTHTK